VFNTAVGSGVGVEQITRHFDSVSVCFSKGLGAPVGSVLLGTRALVDEAARWRKVAGGGWRQAGMLAAACMHALDHHVQRLADDHARAARLAEGLRVAGVDVADQQSNMVFIDIPGERLDAFRAHVDAHRVRLSIGYLPRIRLVTHLDVDDADIDRVVEVLGAFVRAGH
jgi:threonine aldolase